MPIEAAPKRAADAITLLESDHAELRELLAMLSRPLTDRARDRVVFVLVEDLRIHLQIEAEILYPALGLRPDAVAAARTVRNAIEDALADLERFAARGIDLAPTTRRLLSLHGEHAAEEERHVFPQARRALGPQALVGLKDELSARRRELRGSGVLPRGAPVIELRSAALDVALRRAR